MNPSDEGEVKGEIDGNDDSDDDWSVVDGGVDGSVDGSTDGSDDRTTSSAESTAAGDDDAVIKLEADVVHGHAADDSATIQYGDDADASDYSTAVDDSRPTSTVEAIEESGDSNFTARSSFASLMSFAAGSFGGASGSGGNDGSAMEDVGLTVEDSEAVKITVAAAAIVTVADAALAGQPTSRVDAWEIFRVVCGADDNSMQDDLPRRFVEVVAHVKALHEKSESAAIARETSEKAKHKFEALRVVQVVDNERAETDDAEAYAAFVANDRMTFATKAAAEESQRCARVLRKACDALSVEQRTATRCLHANFRTPEDKLHFYEHAAQIEAQLATAPAEFGFVKFISSLRKIAACAWEESAWEAS